MHSGRLVTLAVYENLHEARLVKKKLEDSGIPAYLGGEALALVGPKRGLTSLKLEVAEEDLDHAQLVLQAPSQQAASLPVDQQQGIRQDGLASLIIFYDTAEADHAAQLLRAHGIPCELHNKPSGFLSMMAPGILNIELIVQEEDVERACDILGFTHDAEEADENAPQVEVVRPGPHAFRSESPPPDLEPRHVKRQLQGVLPASEDATVKPTVTSHTVESPPAVEQAPGDVDIPRGSAGWILGLLLLIVLLVFAALRLKL
jgi:hypothetical protein